MKSVKIDEFCDFKFVSGMEYSKNGENLCFVVSQANLKDKGTIWIWLRTRRTFWNFDAE